MRLTPEQEAQLAELEKLRDAPDEPGTGTGRDLSIIIDLGDDKAVARALKLGVLDRGDLDEFDEPAGGDGDDELDEDGNPKKKKKADDDPPPSRRLSIADRALGGNE